MFNVLIILFASNTNARILRACEMYIFRYFVGKKQPTEAGIKYYTFIIKAVKINFSIYFPFFALATAAHRTRKHERILLRQK